MSNKRYETTFTPEERAGILADQGGKCALCGGVMTADHNCEVHHGLPIGVGGSHDETNAFAVHGEPCHTLLDEFASRGFYMQKPVYVVDQLLKGTANIEECFVHVSELPPEVAENIPNYKELVVKHSDRLHNPQQVKTIIKLPLRQADEFLKLGKELGMEYAQTLLKKQKSSE